MLKTNMDLYLSKLFESGKIPGCALKVRKNGNVIYNKCFGYSDVEEQRKVTENTIFRLASMTKLIVAVGIMKLVERGDLSLNDNLLKFFPEYPEEKKRVRIRHLLNHSSSMGQSDISTKFCDQCMDVNDSLAQRIGKWGAMPFDCELGESAMYSPLVNFEILGRILEIVSGLSLEEFLREEILTPLGMHDTSFYVSEKNIDRLASVYNCEGNRLVKIDMNTHPLFYYIQSKPDYNSGTGGLYGTLYDYDRFTTMLANGGELDGVRILKKETIDLMRTPRQITDLEGRPGCPWGLGFRIYEQPEKSDIFVEANTYGWSGALGTHMFINEKTGLSATFMINMGDLGGSMSYISRGIERIIFNK